MVQVRHTKYRSTFFIFPTLIPLIEILPWLLTIVASLAGTAAAAKAYLHKHKFRALTVITLALLVIASVWLYYYARYQGQFENAGSQLVAQAELPVLEPQQQSPQTSAKQENWAVHSENTYLSTPTLTDDLLLIGTFGKTLEARSPKDGQLLWTLHKRHPIYSPPLVAEDRIYVGEGLHEADYSGLTALSKKDGRVLWERRFPSHIQSYPILDEKNGRLWIGGGATGLWSLKIKDGRKLWHAAIGHIDSAPLYRNGRLFTNARLSEEENGSALFELNPDSGKVINSIPLEGNPMSDVRALNDYELLVSTAIGQIGRNKRTDSGWVYKISIKDGMKVLWKTRLAQMAMPDGALSNDSKTAFYALKNGQVWAINTDNGKILWVKNCGEEFRANLQLVEENGHGYVIAASKDGYLNVLSAESGEMLIKTKMDTGGYSAPVYKDGKLYVAHGRSFYVTDMRFRGKEENHDR